MTPYISQKPQAHSHKLKSQQRINRYIYDKFSTFRNSVCQLVDKQHADEHGMLSLFNVARSDFGWWINDQGGQGGEGWEVCTSMILKIYIYIYIRLILTCWTKLKHSIEYQRNMFTWIMSNVDCSMTLLAWVMVSSGFVRILNWELRNFFPTTGCSDTGWFLNPDPKSF